MTSRSQFKIGRGMRLRLNCWLKPVARRIIAIQESCLSYKPCSIVAYPVNYCYGCHEEKLEWILRKCPTPTCQESFDSLASFLAVLNINSNASSQQIAVIHSVTKTAIHFSITTTHLRWRTGISRSGTRIATIQSAYFFSQLYRIAKSHICKSTQVTNYNFANKNKNKTLSATSP